MPVRPLCLDPDRSARHDQLCLIQRSPLPAVGGRGGRAGSQRPARKSVVVEDRSRVPLFMDTEAVKRGAWYTAHEIDRGRGGDIPAVRNNLAFARGRQEFRKGVPCPPEPDLEHPTNQASADRWFGWHVEKALLAIRRRNMIVP